MTRKIRLFSGMVIAVLVLSLAAAAQAPAKRVPTIEDLMNLKSAGSPRISPDGTKVAYTVTEADFDQDAYITHIWLAEVATGQALQFTRGKKSCSSPRRSPEYHGRQLVSFDTFSENPSLGNQMLLSHELGKCLWSHPCRQGHTLG